MPEGLIPRCIVQSLQQPVVQPAVPVIQLLRPSQSGRMEHREHPAPLNPITLNPNPINPISLLYQKALPSSGCMREPLGKHCWLRSGNLQRQASLPKHPFPRPRRTKRHVLPVRRLMCRIHSTGDEVMHLFRSSRTGTGWRPKSTMFSRFLYSFTEAEHPKP